MSLRKHRAKSPFERPISRRLRTLDLFSGIGGISKALMPYAETVAYCEADLHAQAVLLTRMETHDLDNAPIWNDVKTLSAGEFEKAGIIERDSGGRISGIDLVTAGWPCVDISQAGRGAGLAGERSGLFFEIVRLLSELRPPLVFLENVTSLRSRGLDTVLSELSSLGYDCRWTTLSAESLGAPHRRSRFFLVGVLAADADRVELRTQLGRWRRASDRKAALQPGPHGPSQPLARGLQGGGRGQGFWSAEPIVRRVDDGVPFRVDRTKRLGNSVVPQCVREAFETLTGLDQRREAAEATKDAEPAAPPASRKTSSNAA